VELKFHVCFHAVHSDNFHFNSDIRILQVVNVKW
jgi:hypothetical protein